MKNIIISLVAASATLLGSECWDIKSVNDQHFKSMVKNYTDSLVIKGDIRSPKRLDQHQEAIELNKCAKLRTIQKADSMSDKKIASLRKLETYKLNDKERSIRDKAIQTSIKAYAGLTAKRFFPKAQGKLVFLGGTEYLPGKLVLTATHWKNGKMLHVNKKMNQATFQQKYCQSDVSVQEYFSAIGLTESCVDKEIDKPTVQDTVKPIQDHNDTIGYYMLTAVNNYIEVDKLGTKSKIALREGNIIKIMTIEASSITFCLANNQCTIPKYSMSTSRLKRFKKMNMEK